MKANSNNKPDDIIKCKEKSIVNYNIKEVEMTDPETEKKRKVWEYDYVEIKGEVTKAKFKDVLRKKDKDKIKFDEYDAYVEQCCAWGRFRKS